MDTTTATYEELDRLYDRLYDVGDFTPAMRARIAVTLWGMVQTDIAEYLEDDLANYRRAGLAGARYLERRGLGLEPSEAEIAELAAMA